jgi:hypothetical protein
MKVSHYGMPPDDHDERELCQQHSRAQVMFHIIKFSLLILPSCEHFPSTALGYLDEGPCNMG